MFVLSWLVSSSAVIFETNSYFCCTDIADLANKYKHLLSADPDSKYDQVIELNLSEVGIHSDSFIKKMQNAFTRGTIHGSEKIYLQSNDVTNVPHEHL